ncbi:MAG: tRNA guanosine(34) transglycosylase Tgt [Candidatus Polarisedimenticolia bacterium]
MATSSSSRPDVRSGSPAGFRVAAADAATRARQGVLSTRHGDVETPAFMPVGTHGAVRSVSPEELKAAGTRILLSNTYHLYLRPGHEVIAQLGGLHRFMGWDGPILTDSGGYQVFSLAGMRRLTDEGAEFRSHLDGSLHMLTPEKAIEVQAALGSDIAMVLDECPPAAAGRDAVREAMRRTTAWARRCRETGAQLEDAAPAVFGIVQGGVHEDLRREHLQEIVALGFDGYAVGGVSVGEPPDQIHAIGEYTGGLLPAGSARYMMGLGRPQDLVILIGAGFDLFDCVLPTRNARNGTLFTSNGTLHIKNEAHRRDPRPLDEGCPCPACRKYSRAYLRHMFLSGEILGHRLNTLHNLTFYQGLMQGARDAIRAGAYAAWRDAWLTRLAGGIDNGHE